MNPFKAILVLFGIIFMITSCNKDYTCECFSSGKTYPITSESQQGADAECETYQSDPFNGNCELQ
jgi:hypothetical protein